MCGLIQTIINGLRVMQDNTDPEQPAHSFVLASGSPRREQLLTQYGYEFCVVPPDDSAECGVCSGETPPELVGRLAFQKARDVAQRYRTGVFLGADTIVECCGQVLGKPVDREDARRILLLLRNREHHVYSGVCLWRRPQDGTLIRVDRTTLIMDDFSEQQLEAYLDTDLWEGKAGAFGYQDEHDWLRITQGSETNVVGLPMELLANMLGEFAPEVKIGETR